VKPVLNESKVVISIRPRALRPPAAAAYLGCTPNLIEDLWRDGILPFRILGGQRVVDVQDLDKYFESLPKQTGLVSGRRKFMVAPESAESSEIVYR
jgi:hypothetical protein